MKGSTSTTWLRQANDSLRFLKAAWEAIQLACPNTEKNPDTDRAFESLPDLLRGYSNQDFILSIEGHVTILHPVRDSFVDFVQP